MTDSDPSRYLQPVDDGLPMRSGQSYALAKLKVVELYLKIAMTAMRDKPWRATYYLDLQAGPGKNRIDDAVELGSPLISLTCPVPFTNYRFNEGNIEMADALRKRVNASPIRERAVIRQTDVNQAVFEFCDEIKRRDVEFIKGRWPCFNIAFLDPEGLELHWPTIEQLASVNRMDLIINFSTGGLNRTYSRLPELGDKFFGTDKWRRVLSESDSATDRRRKWIDFYLERLQELGYRKQINDSAEIVARNSRNVQVYTIIFASKNDRGLDLWQAAVRSAEQPRLF